MRAGSRSVPVAAAVLALAAACGHGGTPAPSPTPGGPVGTLTVTSEAFADGGTIPQVYVCSGRRPAVAWSGDPHGAAALAVVVDDPDAPGGVFTHWVVLDLPPTVNRLADGPLPAGAHEGDNSEGRRGWTSPCPPSGSGTHHYRFTVYALRTPTGLPDGTRPDRAATAIRGRVLAQGTLTGTVTPG